MSKAPIVYTSTHQIKFSELDPYNHVSTGNYATFDQKKRDPVHPAVPGGGIPATEHWHIDLKRHEDQHHSKHSEQCDSDRAFPPAGSAGR